MPADHLDNISISITLDPLAAAQASFTTLLIVADEANGTTLGGDRVRSYASLAGVQTDADAGEVGTAILAAATAAFAQRPRPSVIKIGRVDTVGLESYTDALTAIKAVDADYYGICIESRTAADVALVAAAVQAEDRLFIHQSGDADWRTAGYPAALSALEGDEHTAGIYHDDAAEWADVAWAAGRLAFDPDTRSAPWDAGVAGVTAYTTAPTDTEKAALDGNDMNHGLPYGGVDFFVDPGVNHNGRPIYEIITSHWFAARLRERVATLKTVLSARGEKVPMTAAGQALIRSEIETQFAIGVSGGHFVSYETTAEAITAADLAAQRMRFTGRAQDAVSGRIFDFDFNFSTTALE